ncbi:hypothetical protein [Glycomyces buryatensis]|uniref:SLATT domain-containing protein n=1 Tax=Glycomyces buryatensis TaxID=2570927 RepID=A0A4S8QL17_9ACTN|nr:hypothetical protein [Glycomyces buryatensis]THV42119.1 hypothetical protein FAB82_07710 [Glycomyces buryatensis]
MSAPVQLTDDQRKHLDFIQSSIARMSSSSTTVKGWGITVSMTAFGLAAAGAIPLVSVLGLTAMAFFGFLDCRYLREERLFRELYNDARQGLVETYSMDRSAYLGRCRWPAVVRSWSITSFYVPLALVGGASLTWSLVQPV